MRVIGACKAACVLSLIWGPALLAAGPSEYRGLKFGSDPATAAKQVGARLEELTTVHRRPALIQELEWRPNRFDGSMSQNSDPVRDGILRFYNGQLFQIVSTYDSAKIEGMTSQDVVDAISTVYGTPTKPAVEIPYHSNYGETAKVIARWENEERSYSLVRTGDRESYALVLSMKSLDALAQTAIKQALRLDTQEAPQRAIDLEKKQEVDSRNQLKRARSANMPNFRP